MWLLLQIMLLIYLCTSQTSIVANKLLNFGINVNINTSHDNVTFTMTGPASFWFGIGFGQTVMNGCYSIIVGLDTNEYPYGLEQVLATHSAGATLPSSISVESDIVSNSTRTVVFSRGRIGKTSLHYTFPSTATAINIIYAYGTTNNFDLPHSRATDTLVFKWSPIVSSTGAVLSFPSIDGPLMSETWEVAPAQFGYQKFSGQIEGVLILPANETYHKECPKSSQTPEGAEPTGLNPYIRYIQDWFISENDIKDFILVIDRLDCYFVDKVEVAQALSAIAVIICDWRAERLFSMWQPQDWTDDITIPSVLLENDHCQILMSHMGVQNWDPTQPEYMKYPTASKMNWTIVNIQWGLPHLDDIVNYELWTSSNDYLGAQFKSNFNTTAIMLEKSGDAQFTPHMYILNGSHWDCDKIINGNHTLPCRYQCSNNGRYCAVDPEYDLNIGLDGIDVIQENLRSLCVWEYDMETNLTDGGAIWWHYTVLWEETCGISSNSSKNFHANCSYAQMDKLTSGGSLSNYVRSKIINTGGYGYTDGVNTILRAETRLKYNSSIYAVPMIRVNEFLMHGNIDCPRPVSTETCMVLDAICSGFINGTQPDVCYAGNSTPSPSAVCANNEKDCNGTCFGNRLIDACGKCLLSSSMKWNECIGCDGKVNETYDCAGICGGHSALNTCGYCKDTRLSNFSTFGVDCNGGCLTGFLEDECGNCLLPSNETWNQCLHISTSSPTQHTIYITTSSPTLVIPASNVVTSNISATTMVCIVLIIVVILLSLGIFLWRNKVLKRLKFTNLNNDYEQPLMQEMTGNIRGSIVRNTGDTPGNIVISNSNKQLMHDAINDDIIKSVNEKYETATGDINENNINNRFPAINPEIFTDNSDENNINYFITQKLLIEVQKLLYVEAAIIDIIDNGQFIIIQYDNYNNKATEKLHVINDAHRIKPLDLIKSHLLSDDNTSNNKNDKRENIENEESVIKNDEYNECVVCMDKMPQYACVPCGHYCLCKDCKDVINNKCPICQAKCTVLKIFK